MLFEVLLREPDKSQKSIRIENSKLRIENLKIELKVVKQQAIGNFKKNQSFSFFFVVTGVNNSC